MVDSTHGFIRDIQDATLDTCAPCVCNPERTQILKGVSAKKLVSLKGPGSFLAAEVVKQEGSNDLTFVILDIDGRNVSNLSYAAARNSGLTQQNPHGIVYLQADKFETITIGYPSPLRFKRELNLSVRVNEDGVVQILANVIHGK